jgi:tetratricopeptide (TPR) repeat protein
MAKLWPLIENEKVDFLSDMKSMSLEERCDYIERDLEDGLFEETRDELEDLIDEYPGCWEPLFLMGTCLALQGDAEQAISFLEQAAVLHPSSDIYYNLAGVHRSLLQIQPAVTSLRKVIELDGAKGEVGKRAKADLEALASSIRESSGLTLDRYFENAERFDQAFRCLMDGRFEQAVRGFNLVLESQPDHVQSHGNLGLAYAGLGDRVAAIRHLDKAIELDPDYEPAIDNRRIILALQSAKG